jgi:hypothetical protein
MKTLLTVGLLFSSLLSFCNDKISIRQNFYKQVKDNHANARKFLTHKDPEIRRYVLYLIIKDNPIAALNDISNALNDPDKQVRLIAVSALPSIKDKDPRVLQLLKTVASKDKSRAVRQIAVQATWPFYREIKLLKNDPTWDYEVKIIKSIQLPKSNWLFTLDQLQDGHLKGFYKSNYDVSKWKKIKMGVWEKQGFPNYDGVAWYQIKFKMPKKIDCNAVEIHFDGVDESAWVWLNGTYLGCHDIGPEGWKEPFSVDCRKEILWDKENVLTIRVFDAAYAGGIYKPIRVDILK